MAMDSTDLTIHESEDEDVYVSVEKNIEITKHGNRQHTPVSSFCFFFTYILSRVLPSYYITITLRRENCSMTINSGAPR